MSKHKHDIRSLLIILGLLLAIWGLYKAGHEVFVPTADITPIAIDKGHQLPTKGSNNDVSTHPLPQPTIPELYDLTNQQRTQAGLQPLALDDRLTASATAKCQDMLINGWGHLDKQGRHGYHFIQELIPDAHEYSENLAEGYDTSPSIMTGWMESPPHREAILKPNFTAVGFGLCKNGTDQYTVQHFIDD